MTGQTNGDVAGHRHSTRSQQPPLDLDTAGASTPAPAAGLYGSNGPHQATPYPWGGPGRGLGNSLSAPLLHGSYSSAGDPQNIVKKFEFGSPNAGAGGAYPLLPPSLHVAHSSSSPYSSGHRPSSSSSNGGAAVKRVGSFSRLATPAVGRSRASNSHKAPRRKKRDRNHARQKRGESKGAAKGKGKAVGGDTTLAVSVSAPALPSAKSVFAAAPVTGASAITSPAHIVPSKTTARSVLAEARSASARASPVFQPRAAGSRQSPSDGEEAGSHHIRRSPARLPELRAEGTGADGSSPPPLAASPTAWEPGAPPVPADSQASPLVNRPSPLTLTLSPRDSSDEDVDGPGSESVSATKTNGMQPHPSGSDATDTDAVPVLQRSGSEVWSLEDGSDGEGSQTDSVASPGACAAAAIVSGPVDGVSDMESRALEAEFYGAGSDEDEDLGEHAQRVRAHAKAAWKSFEAKLKLLTTASSFVSLLRMGPLPTIPEGHEDSEFADEHGDAVAAATAMILGDHEVYQPEGALSAEDELGGGLVIHGGRHRPGSTGSSLLSSTVKLGNLSFAEAGDGDSSAAPAPAGSSKSQRRGRARSTKSNGTQGNGAARRRRSNGEHPPTPVPSRQKTFFGTSHQPRAANKRRPRSGKRSGPRSPARNGGTPNTHQGASVSTRVSDVRAQAAMAARSVYSVAGQDSTPARQRKPRIGSAGRTPLPKRRGAFNFGGAALDGGSDDRPRSSSGLHLGPLRRRKRRS